MERDSVRYWWPPFDEKLLARPFDDCVEDARAHGVALAWLLADAACEREVVRLGPLGGVLVFAEELHQLRLQGDLTDAGGSLGGDDAEQALAQVEITPAAGWSTRRFAVPRP